MFWRRSGRLRAPQSTCTDRWARCCTGCAAPAPPARRRALSCARLLQGAAQERGAGEKSAIGARAAATGIDIVSAVTNMPPGDAPPRRTRAALPTEVRLLLSSLLSPHRPCRRGQVRRLRRGGGRGRAARRRARHADRVMLAARHVAAEGDAERLDLRRGRWPR